MKCTEFELLFSDYMDGELDAEQHALLADHLEQCDSCRASYEAFRYALGDLQSIELREQSPRETAAILAAVDRANARPSSTSRTLWTHLLAAAAGGLLVWWLWPDTVRVEEKLVEVRVPVERRVEVPVDRIVEVERIVEVLVPTDRIVERVVEVPVERVVDRILEVESPLQLRSDRVWAVASAFADLASLAARAEERVTAHADVPLSAVSANSTPLLARAATQESSRSPVRVVRTGGQISLQTRGALQEVVPALIAMLSDADPLVRQVVEERLIGIREEAGLPAIALAEAEEPRTATGLANLRALIHGAPELNEPVTERSTIDSWRAWWNSHCEQLGAFESRPTI